MPLIRVRKARPEMNPLPYLDELLSLNIKSVREAKALLICMNKGFFRDDGWFEYYENTGHCSSHIHSVFGCFNSSWKRYMDNNLPDVYEKNGIEILHAQPTATKSTYSRKCRITIKQLKEACKANGLKTTGDKKTLLHSLMKI